MKINYIFILLKECGSLKVSYIYHLISGTITNIFKRNRLIKHFSTLNNVVHLHSICQLLISPSPVSVSISDISLNNCNL